MSQVDSCRIAAPRCDAKLYRDVEAHVAHIACHVATRTLPCLWPCHTLYCDPKGRPQPRYKSCIATPPLARPRMRPRCLMSLLASRPCCGPTGHVVGPCSRASWPYRGPPASRLCALCHDKIHCIVTQTGKWAVAHPVSCLFCKYIYIFFFHFVPPTGRPQKKYIFFSFSSRTK